MNFIILFVSGMAYLFLNTSFPIEKSFEEKGYGAEAVIELSHVNDFQEQKTQSVKASTIILFIYLVSFLNLVNFVNKYITRGKHFLLAVFFKSNYFQNDIYS
ncbi:hypothetical protein [Halalkalibacter okhensis]|uniref:Uncharacterized protein n=1 Tax=Halalkalibacter okhensis TaxID=333138 RepID=A0A0B0IGZ8_9BACI|nr:hypothetical protein [Halalkalibacter okhensis]KHF38921.1 hypothetical protein LQ50_18510 [Halalkalibacter okhensis]